MRAVLAMTHAMGLPGGRRGRRDRGAARLAARAGLRPGPGLALRQGRAAPAPGAAWIHRAAGPGAARARRSSTTLPRPCPACTPRAPRRPGRAGTPVPASSAHRGRPARPPRRAGPATGPAGPRAVPNSAASLSSTIVPIRSRGTPSATDAAMAPRPAASSATVTGPGATARTASTRPVAVRDRHSAQLAQVAVVRRAGRADHGGAGQPGQLHGERCRPSPPPRAPAARRRP